MAPGPPDQPERVDIGGVVRSVAIVERPAARPWYGKGRAKWQEAAALVAETVHSGQAVAFTLRRPDAKLARDSLRWQLNRQGLHLRSVYRRAELKLVCWAEEMDDTYLQRGLGSGRPE